MDHFNRSIIALEWKLHPVDGIARFDLRQYSHRQIQVCSSFVEVAVYLREKGNVL